MKLFWICFIVGSTFSSFAQKDVGVIWMGFEHNWTYNHRLNRIGDYVEQPEFEGYNHPVKHIHTGATGIGLDNALFTSFYTAINSDVIGFQAGYVDLRLENKEGERAYAKEKIRIPLKGNLKNKDQIVAVLNGFDLVANIHADKLKLLGIEISDPLYNADKSAVDLEIEVSFIANCGSLECSRFVQKFDYSIKIQYLLIAGNSKDFNSKERSFLKSYEWDKKDSFEEGIVNETIYGKPGFPKASIGFKSIMINMDQDHWLVDWHTAIHPQFYDKRTGKYDFALDLLLKQWKKIGDSPYKFNSNFSKRKDGWAYLDGAVILLQFKDACLTSLSRYGSINWKGMNKEAESNDAVNVHRFKIEDNCK